MPLIYITGPSGAGKSAVRKELTKRGYEAHDTDEDGMSAWYNIETGERVEYPDKANRTSDWYKKHAARVLPERVKLLAERAKDKLIFLCGIPSNDMELAEHFSKIVCLVIDEETMKQRVATRSTNNFGKSPAELDLMLYWHGKMLERYKEWGATMIDAHQPLEKVVDDILASVELPPIITLHLPQYQVDAEPDYKAIGKIIDDELRKHFLGKKVVIRCIGSQDHPNLSLDELTDIVLKTGTDKYDPARIGVGYEDFVRKGIKVDFYGEDVTITKDAKIMGQALWEMHHSAIGDRGYGVHVDLVLVYDYGQLNMVMNLYDHHPTSDGFVFKNPEDKPAALLGVIRIES